MEMSEVVLRECYYDDDPIAVLEYGYNFIIWFKVGRMILAFDIIFDNSIRYSLSVLSLEYARNRYNELIKEGWTPIIEFDE